MFRTALSFFSMAYHSYDLYFIHFQGDSGGPLVCKVGDSYVQAGIVSWGASCGRYSNIMPSAFASVAYYVPWIEETIAKNP